MIITQLLIPFFLINKIVDHTVITTHLTHDGQIVSTSTEPIKLNLKNSEIWQISVVGDTGCRVRGKEIQNCLSQTEWPLHKIMQEVANDKPQIIIHIGDFHYRVSCKESPLCEDLNSTLGYGFDSWVADWFNPNYVTQNIPSILLRGNHENCQRGWEIWEKYLAPYSNSVCPKQDQTSITDLGDIIMINYDSSWISDEPLNQGNSTKDQLEITQELNKILQRLKVIDPLKQKKIFFLTHKPPYGVVPYKDDKIKDHIIWSWVSPRFTQAIESTDLNQWVTVYLSGHIHNAQVIKGQHPLQIVVGHSGSKLDEVNEFANIKLNTTEGSTALILTQKKDDFGYLNISNHPFKSGLIFEFKDQDRKTVYLKSLSQ